uniref:ADAM metallopeptidase with thrombospondin type 1 motif 6 n=1 Tax=Strongyloides stercoralis TaxID=6248 RepID=A0A0K0EAR2_STRER
MLLFSYVLKAVLTLILIPVPRSHKEPSLEDERGYEEQV